MQRTGSMHLGQKDLRLRIGHGRPALIAPELGIPPIRLESRKILRRQAAQGNLSGKAGKGHAAP
jgi:hypothetical protein